MIVKIALAAVMLSVLLPSVAFAATYPLEYQGSTVNISYDSQGVVINNIQADLDWISLVIDVSVTGSPGILEIMLERDFIDSTDQGADVEYFIILDGFEEPVFDEINTNTESRTLRIELTSGTEEVEIFATEFGTPSTPKPEVISEPEPEVISEPEPEVISEPEIEEPKVPMQEESKIEEKPKTVCGPGTVLKDGTCVLEKKCGAGTILQDGQCVVDSSQPVPSTPRDSGRQLVIATIVAFVIGLAVIFVLWLISKA